MEEIDVARPLKPMFYRWYVDNIYNRCKMDEFDEVFHALNNYHENIKLTIELSPSKFLDTQLINAEWKYITKVHRKENKTPIHWLSKIPNQRKTPSGPTLEIGGLGAFFWGTLLGKKGTLFSCTPKTDVIFNHF